MSTDDLERRLALLEATVAELLAAIGMPHAAKVFERLAAIDAAGKAEAERAGNMPALRGEAFGEVLSPPAPPTA